MDLFKDNMLIFGVFGFVSYVKEFQFIVQGLSFLYLVMLCFGIKLFLSRCHRKCPNYRCISIYFRLGRYKFDFLVEE